MNVPSAVATMLAINAILSERTIALRRSGTASQWIQLFSVKPCQT